MRSFLEDVIVPLLGMAACIVVIVVACSALAFVCVYIGSSCVCNRLQQLNPELSFQVTFFAGCLVQAPNGIWVPVEDMGYYFVEVVE